ncbi:hypothetical protein BH23PSE1_BH23PSE1_02800 [soil metagenome]
MVVRAEVEVKPRIAGIDLARCLAVAGMLAVHVGPTHLSDPAGRLFAIMAHGRASILFALLAGIGVSLLAASRGRTQAETRLRLVWHAAVLLALGLWLQSLNISVRVILAHYGLLFVLGAACIALSGRAIAALAAGSAVFGPLGFLIGRIVDPQKFDRSPVEWTDGPLDILHGLVLSGPYPVITWAAPFLLGMLLGRRDFRARRLRLALVVGGAALALAAAFASNALESALALPSAPAGWHRLVIDRPHSQMPLWLLGSVGSALFALGVSLHAADLMGRTAWPLVAAGQIALTIYVGHLLALHWLGRAMRSSDVGGALLIVLVVMAIAAVLAVTWRAFFAKGPVESLLALPWAVAARYRYRRS